MYANKYLFRFWADIIYVYKGRCIIICVFELWSVKNAHITLINVLKSFTEWLWIESVWRGREGGGGGKHTASANGKNEK